MKQYHHLIPHTKWIKDLNIRPETIKLEENTGGKLLDIGLGNDFFKNLTPNVKQLKKKLINGTTESQNASAQQRKPSTEWKGNIRNGRKYLQIISLRNY